MFFSLLTFHISAGAIALLAGYAVIFVNKGGTSHKYLGRCYVVSMLALGLTGTYIAVSRQIPLSILNGLVLCYFVLSSLNVIRQPARRSNTLDNLLFAFVLMLTLGFAWYAFQATQVDGGKLGGFGVEAYLVFGSVMLVCCIADFRYIKSGGLSGNSRLIRHLWRMFFPLFMSTAAFFLGQAKHLPEPLRKPEILLTPVFLVIVSAIYWTFKVSGKGSKFRKVFSKSQS